MLETKTFYKLYSVLNPGTTNFTNYFSQTGKMIRITGICFTVNGWNSGTEAVLLTLYNERDNAIFQVYEDQRKLTDVGYIVHQSQIPPVDLIVKGRVKITVSIDNVDTLFLKLIILYNEV